MRLAVASALVFALSCGQGGGSRDPQVSCADPRPISVNAVNVWPGLDPVAYAAEQSDNCASVVHIEAFPWMDRSGACDAAHPTLCTETYRVERRAFLAAMADREITTLVTSQNVNAYGPWTLGKAAFRQHMIEIREDAAAVGFSRVWVGAPSEPWMFNRRWRIRLEDDGPLERTLVARSEWPGTFVLADKGAGKATGKPYFPGVAFDYLEVHPCSIADTYESLRFGGKTLTVTDCGAVLVPDQQTTKALASEAIRLGVPLLFYDHFALQPDVASMRALGDVLR